MTNEHGEYWLYLLIHGGYARVVGEYDNWSVAYELKGDLVIAKTQLGKGGVK
jgi:hypothetical protein